MSRRRAIVNRESRPLAITVLSVTLVLAGFYVYASVHIFVGVCQGGPPYALEILVPQVLAVIVAAALLVWPARYRERFG